MTPTNRRIPGARPPSPDVAEIPVAGGGVSRLLRRMASVVGVALGLASVVAMSLGTTWLARRYVTTTSRFAVVDVKVLGNERRSASAIAAESGIVPGVNVFAVDLNSARYAVLSDPWISDAVLTRSLPGSIVVQVTERKAAALVSLGDLFLSTAEGDPFKKLEADDPVDLPLITGLTPERVAGDREGARRLIRRGIDLAAEYERGPLAHRAPLEEVHVDESGAFTLVVGRPTLQLVLGGPPFRRKLDEAARVVAELERRHAQASSIMLDNEARPERVVARLR